jgi:predicted MarR family transcription regulator
MPTPQTRSPKKRISTTKSQSAAAISTSATPPRIVSSAHLAVGAGADLSEFEYGLIIAWHAFGRWVVRCMSAAGVKDATMMEVLVLHHVHHRGREKKLADICFVLNVEDTHIVAYSLKKLVAAGLVASEKRGKEVAFSTTDHGAEVITRYRQVRESCLVTALTADGNTHDELTNVASLLRLMSGLYDQAARAASSL